MITMAYFHPFTLCSSGADDFVPHARNLKNGSQSWEDALKEWLGGNVLCGEAQRYIHFFNVAQMRPDYISEENKKKTKNTYFLMRM